MIKKEIGRVLQEYTDFLHAGQDLLKAHAAEYPELIASAKKSHAAGENIDDDAKHYQRLRTEDAGVMDQIRVTFMNGIALYKVLKVAGDMEGVDPACYKEFEHSDETLILYVLDKGRIKPKVPGFIESIQKNIDINFDDIRNGFIKNILSE